MDDEFSRQTLALRKLQDQCKHPSWVCSCCHLFKDNIRDEQRLKIEKLEAKIAEHESSLTSLGFYFIPMKTLLESVILELPVKIEIPEMKEHTEHYTPLES